MGASAQRLRRGLLAALCAGVAGTGLTLPDAAAARNGGLSITVTRDGKGTTTVVTHDDGEEWNDYNRTLLQMQRESISAQEEQAREAGRERRRQEIEKAREKSAAEHEAYFDAILEDSRAALKAPLGVYYRKPGYTSPDGPGVAARTVEVDGVAYVYDQGIFWLPQGSQAVVVTAPFGAVVAELPNGATRIPGRAGPLWYFFGTFFGARDGSYEVIRPPPGIAVFYLPDGYRQEQVKGVTLYRFGETYFKPVFIQGVLAYQVVAAE